MSTSEKKTLLSEPFDPEVDVAIPVDVVVDHGVGLGVVLAQRLQPTRL